MTRSHIATTLFCAAALAGSVSAQAPAVKAPLAVPGVSPQGNAAIAKVQQQEDPLARAAIAKLQALVPQLSQVAQAPTIDVEKFGALLRQQDALSSQLKARGSERIIAILRALPAADRGAFLRAIAQHSAGQGGAAQGR